MAEIYRVEKGSEEWKYKAYDYVRTDAFCLGQNIPIELEFGQDESKDDLQAILLTEDPVSYTHLNKSRRVRGHTVHSPALPSRPRSYVRGPGGSGRQSRCRTALS